MEHACQRFIKYLLLLIKVLFHRGRKESGWCSCAFWFTAPALPHFMELSANYLNDCTSIDMQCSVTMSTAKKSFKYWITWRFFYVNILPLLFFLTESALRLEWHFLTQCLSYCGFMNTDLEVDICLGSPSRGPPWMSHRILSGLVYQGRLTTFLFCF